MPLYHTRGLGDGNVLKRCMLATAGSLAPGQPIQITDWPVYGTVAEYKVQICPDGQRPDGVITAATSRTGPAGSFVLLACDNFPVLAGAAFIKGAVLKVEKGKWVAAASGDNHYALANQAAAAADDVIPGDKHYGKVA